nr:stealth family protein [Streptomyces sp. BA2]
MSPRAVHVCEGLTPLGARELNLRAVQRVLDSAGIGWFAVRSRDHLASALGVAAEEKTTVLGALREELTLTGGYLAYADRGGSSTPRIVAPDETAAWHRLCQAGTVRVVWFRSVPSHTLFYGWDSGCDLEFWPEDPEITDRLIAPRRNLVCDAVSRRHDPIVLPGERFTPLARPVVNEERGTLRPIRTRREFDVTHTDEITFPVDAVYTWVDGMDPKWQRRRAATRGENYHEESGSIARYISRDELKYSLRSIHMFLPWIRNIYIVTDRQTPHWFDHANGRARIVDHTEIFRDPRNLPTFNSHAIESQLHHIEGLSENFIYFNDDMFIGHPVPPSAFFHSNGVAKFFSSPAMVPHGDADPSEVPTSVAAKNNRRLIEARFGKRIIHKLKHIPYALRRSVLCDIEREFPDDHSRTAASKVRSMSDISIASSLHHYYGFHTGRSMPGSLRYGYIQLDDDTIRQKLDRALFRRDLAAFCINDSASDPGEIEAQGRLISEFLESYFPVVSPFEKTEAS